MPDLNQATVDEAQSVVDISFFSPTQALPVIITPRDQSTDLIQWSEKNKPFIKANKEKYGAVLFRGFDIKSAEQFEQAIEATSSQSIEYHERTSPRDTVEGNVYTSTSHPKESEIFLHTEQSFNLNFPLHIYFNCHVASPTGGCTPLADTRKIFNRIPADIRETLIEKGYLYQRNFIENMYVSWQTSFQTQDKSEVEA
ncbi:MAG: alpha-ketoglutarate-dependent taurine dioxygenase, partial [Alteromonadaceae bacterium]